jgi:lipoprotein LprG
MALSWRALAGLAGAVAIPAVLSGCTDTAAEDPAPAEVLAEAKANLDETSGVRIRLATEELPASVDGLLRAEGVGTHDPAFEGELSISVSGVTADVPVVAAEGKVMAQLPFTTEYVEVEPEEYAAPDPAGLMDPDDGLSSMLTAAEEVVAGESVRSGGDVLSSYTGTVPGDVVSSIVPSAAADTDFEATFTIDDGQRLREAVLSGPFYPDAEPVVYTVTFDEYDTTADITLP